MISENQSSFIYLVVGNNL